MRQLVVKDQSRAVWSRKYMIQVWTYNCRGQQEHILWGPQRNYDIKEIPPLGLLRLTQWVRCEVWVVVWRGGVGPRPNCCSFGEYDNIVGTFILQAAIWNFNSSLPFIFVIFVMDISTSYSFTLLEKFIVQREYVRGFPLNSEKLLLTSLAFVVAIMTNK